MGLSANQMVKFIAQQLMLPLNHSYLPNLEKNIWPELQDPFYDRGSRYTVPYVVWMDGIGWRNDKIGNDIAGDEGAVGHPLGVVGSGGARSASSTTSATRSRCRCSATPCAPASGPISTPTTRRSSRRRAATSPS